MLLFACARSILSRGRSRDRRRLLGFTGVWVAMEDSPYRAIVRYDPLPPRLAVADGGRAVLARYLYEDLMFDSRIEISQLLR